jgi:uncharacterized pyridoxamine 5'-phosphate oxidase family protein
MILLESLRHRLGPQMNVIFATSEGGQPRMRTMILINDERGLFFATDAGT